MPSSGGSAGAGTFANSASTASRAWPRLGIPPSTDTKLGQKPFWHEKSLLHELWSIARLRPNSVSTGITDTQFDWVLQSPQPSHTRVLMNERRLGSGKRPRLRRRRFSAAQVWS